MKVCSNEDFKKRGFDFEQQVGPDVKNRLCPDITEENKDFYKIKNLYTNKYERLNFAIEIHKCKNSSTKTCKNDV